MTDKLRGKHGRFDVDPATAELDAQAARLRSQGLGYRQIATEMGCTLSAAHDRVRRALAAVPIEAVNELRQIEAERIDRVITKAWGIVEDRHTVVSNGKVITDVVDNGAVLAALTVILRASAEKRKLFGLDAPARQVVTVITEDAVDAELRRLEQELAAAEAEDAHAG